MESSQFVQNSIKRDTIEDMHVNEAQKRVILSTVRKFYVCCVGLTEFVAGLRLGLCPGMSGSLAWIPGQEKNEICS